MERPQIIPTKAEPILVDGLNEDPRVSQYSGVTSELIRQMLVDGQSPLIIPDLTSPEDLATIESRIESAKYEQEFPDDTVGDTDTAFFSTDYSDNILGTEHLGYKPLIGIPARRVEGVTDDDQTETVQFTSATLVNIEIIRQNGGIPVIIPSGIGFDNQQAIIEILDGVLFAGGGDINDSLSGVANNKQGFDSPEAAALSAEAKIDMPTMIERDTDEHRIVEIAKNLGMAVVGFCRGLQIINISHGGTLRYIDDVNADPDDDTHLDLTDPANNTTQVQVFPGTELGDTILKAIASDNTDTIELPSAHHMAINQLGENLSIVGESTGQDRIIKFVTNKEQTFFATQGHPEWNPDAPFARAMLRLFMSKAIMYARNRGRLHLAS